MTLENQVVSLELAQKLKELGVKQESLFYWKFDNGTMKKFCNSDIKIETEVIFGKRSIFENLGTWDTAQAYTVAELGEMLLPNHAVDQDSFPKPHKYNERHKWITYMENDGWESEIAEDTEANARAKMLLYLLENKLITP